MKKTVVLGDTHGRSFWKLIVHQEKPDRIIFIGDYFDSYNIPGIDQIHNFKEIIQYKLDNPQIEVVLLIGNHDYHYFPEIGENGTSGYQYHLAPSISQVVNENREHLQIAYNFGEFLFTHAGVSLEFMDDAFGPNNWSVENIAVDLNELFRYKPRKFEFAGFDPYGDNTYQTPIWIRPRSLMAVNREILRDKVIQVVGHTSMTKIDIEGKATGGRYYFIDTLGTSGEYLIIENNNVTVGTIN
jgi:predicted phosphodiesterase